MESCNGCDAVDQPLNDDGYCRACQIATASENVAVPTGVCVFCCRPHDQPHTADCTFALAHDFADGTITIRDDSFGDAREAFETLRAQGLL